MKSKTSIRLLVLLSCVLTIATLAQQFRLDRAAATDRTAAAAVDRDLASVAVKLADLRMAQTAYLAAGQNPQFWTKHTAELAADIEGELARLRSLARSTDGTTRIDAASAAFTELMAADAKARTNLSPDRLLVASDVVLVESLDIAQRAASELAAARAAEERAAEADANRRSQLHLATAGGGMLAVLCCLLVAMRLAGRVASSASPAATMAQMLRDLPPPVRTQAQPASATAVPGATAPASPSLAQGGVSAPTVATGRPATSPLGLPEAAELCVDLARVMDGRDLPALLQRAATLLEASGLIVWVADDGGSTLHPLLTHGYPDKVLRRLGPLDVKGNNVTALAYQSLRPQTMNATGSSQTGALAVPLVTASGCNGVLAAEVRQSRPGPETLALARIVAAQLATIIGPAEAAASERARATAD